MKVRHPQFPARGRKLLPGHRLQLLELGQTPSIPRKGTETSLGWENPAFRNIGQTPSIPRKGTETCPLQTLALAQQPSQTPSIPRKGTETQLAHQIERPKANVRHPQFPARGRKLHHDSVHRVYPKLPDRRSDTLNSPQGDGNQS